MQPPAHAFYSAPDVSPEDVWGDPACLVPAGQGPAALLPSMRAMPEKSGAARDHGGGLGNVPKTAGQSAAQTSPKLEVLDFCGSVVRLSPEEPAAAWAPRKPAIQERPPNPDEPGEAREWGITDGKPVFWLVSAGVVVAAVIVGSIMALPLLNNATGSTTTKWVVEPVPDAKALNNILAMRGEAERVFREFLGTQSSDSVVQLVRDPERVGELIRSGRRLPNLSTAAARPKIRSWGARETGSLAYGILAGTLPDYANFEAYFTISNGRMVMDWKASTGYGTADFQQLTRKQGNPAEIRGWITAAEFYSIAFSENSHQAYQLASPDKQQVIWVYARRGSELDEELQTLIKGGYILQGRKEARKVTLRLDPGPASSLPSQWELVELLHKEWIAP